MTGCYHGQILATSWLYRGGFITTWRLASALRRFNIHHGALGVAVSPPTLETPTDWLGVLDAVVFFRGIEPQDLPQDRSCTLKLWKNHREFGSPTNLNEPHPNSLNQPISPNTARCSETSRPGVVQRPSRRPRRIVTSAGDGNDLGEPKGTIGDIRMINWW